MFIKYIPLCSICTMEMCVSKPSVSIEYTDLKHLNEVVDKKNDDRSIAMALSKGTNTFGKY